MRLAIVGSRELAGFDKSSIFRHLPHQTTSIVSGGAAGIDMLAEELAQELGIPFKRIAPDYAAYGKRAEMRVPVRIIDS